MENQINTQNSDEMIPEMPRPKRSRLEPKSTVLAGFLSAFPGLGQVYVGYYKHGFINILVFAGCITVIVNSNNDIFLPLIPLFIFFFWAYNIIDAIRKAHAYNRILAGGTLDLIPEEGLTPGISGSLPGGTFLILAGLAALSYTAFDIPLDWLEKWWPIIPVAFGGYLIFLDRKEKKQD